MVPEPGPAASHEPPLVVDDVKLNGAPVELSDTVWLAGAAEPIWKVKLNEPGLTFNEELTD